MTIAEDVPTLWRCQECKWSGTSDQAIDHALEEGHLDIHRAVSLITSAAKA